MPDDPLTLTVKQACKKIGISRTHIYALIKEGRIRKIKVGRRTLLPYEDIVALVAVPEPCAA